MSKAWPKGRAQRRARLFLQQLSNTRKAFWTFHMQETGHMPPTITDLIPVPVHGHTVFVANADVPLVPLRPICAQLGLDWRSQQRKVQTHPTFAPCVVMVTTHDASGRLQEMLALPADLAMGWLLTIHPDNVAPKVRAALIAFQRQLYGLAFAAWQAARNGLPVHTGGRPVQAALFDVPNPMDWLRHPTFQVAMAKWAEATAVENAARERAGVIRKEARAVARSIGLTGRAFAVLRDWAALPVPAAQPALRFDDEEG